MSSDDTALAARNNSPSVHGCTWNSVPQGGSAVYGAALEVTERVHSVVPLAVRPMQMRMRNPFAVAMVEPALQVPMVPQCKLPLRGMSQDPSRMPCESAHRCVRRYAAAVRSLTSHRANSAPRDPWNNLQQMAGLRIAVEAAGNLGYALGEMRRSPGDCAGYLRKHPLGRGRNRLCDNWKQFAGSHSDQRQEVFGSFIFRFRLGRQLSQVLHHGVGVDLAYRADLVLVFKLAFFFAFAQQAAQAAE
jgi:hypothetical protein